jgi:hypothetical protein
MWTIIGSVLWLLLLLVLLLSFRWILERLPSLGDLYFLRIPILTVAAVWSFCLAALFLPSARLLLGNAFDLDPALDVGWLSILLFAKDVFLVSLSACLLGSVVMVTWRLVQLYAPMRLADEPSINIDPNIKVRHIILFLSLTSLPVIFSVIYKSSIAPSALSRHSALEAILGIIMAVGGVLFSLVLLWFINLKQRTWTESTFALRPPNAHTSINDIVGTSPDFFVPTRQTSADADTLLNRARRHEPKRHWVQAATTIIYKVLPEEARTGYIGQFEDRSILILPGHLAAGVLLMVTFAFYLGVGMLMYGLAYLTGWAILAFVPTLCYLLLLTMFLCWGLSGLAFFFDRYRIPVLIPLILVFLAASIVGSDYYYPTVPRQADTEIGKIGPRGGDSTPDTMIVVAANGGGIQAAAWTAQVLVGLEKDCRSSLGCDQKFGKSIRLISSVSGGSAGTMYFVNEYEQDGTLPEKGLEEIVTRAEGSSLDHIAWGLLYPDLARTVNILLPWLPGPFNLDRGQTLDKAWLREDMAWPKREGIKQGLSVWQVDTEAGRRPGVIFNTTIAETGQRLPLSTVTLPEDLPGGIRYKRLLEHVEPKSTIPVVTAARLSAAFPYVSPAARAKKPAGGAFTEEDGYHEDHIVDGGYYDNYGVSSLVEWLDWELTHDPKHRPEKVVVIQIISSPTVNDLGPRSQEGGLQELLDKVLYQVIAPASTVLNVRGAGQSTHSQVELSLLKEKWEKGNPCVPIIIPKPFVFDGPEPPLSWHLTQKDKQEIETAWQRKTASREEITKLLTGEHENCG